MPPVVRLTERHDDIVTGAGLDVAVTARAAVALHRLVRLHPADLDGVGRAVAVGGGRHPNRAQRTSATATMTAAATRT